VGSESKESQVLSCRNYLCCDCYAPLWRPGADRRRNPQSLREVRRMQELAEGMFQQPTQEMAILWAIERNARVKDPTLEEYIEMCLRGQKEIEREEKNNEKESLV